MPLPYLVAVRGCWCLDGRARAGLVEGGRVDGDRVGRRRVGAAPRGAPVPRVRRAAPGAVARGGARAKAAVRRASVVRRRGRRGGAPGPWRRRFAGHAALERAAGDRLISGAGIEQRQDM